MKKIIILFILSIVTTWSFAQTAEEGMAVEFRQSGKIYVVVAVITVVVIGLFIYLFTIDRKIKKLEEEK
jgi:CcmD family protein